MSAAWLGCDLGTGGVRVVAVDDAGAVLGRGERPLESRRPGDGRHEQDPDRWWPAFAAATRDALAAVSGDRVGGLAVCGTSGTIVLVDGDGAPLSPALMYDDARAAAQAARIGAPASWALPKLLWLLEHHPDLAGRARVAHQPDVITRRLAGHPVAADSSHALKTGYDLAVEAWPAAVRDLLAPAALPDVVRPGTRLSRVGAAAAAETGLAPGTPIFAGMTDGCAAQIATGALRPGDWSAVLGTTLVLKGVATAPLTDPAGVIYNHRAPDGEWLPGGASSCGAGALVAAFPGRDLDRLTVAAAPHQATALLTYPLVGRGERFPFAAPDAEGFVLGTGSDGERFAGLLQGLAFVERLCFDVLDRLGAPTGGELTLTGRAAANRPLCQLRADALGRPVRRALHGDSAFGMAVLAAAGGHRLAEVALRMAAPGERFDPDPARTEPLLARYVDWVGELRRRGWLPPADAEHAVARAGAG